MATATIPLPRTDTAWEALASCAASDVVTSSWFFSDEITEIAAAQRICATCPVIEECLETALTRGEQWGVWGGQLFASGRIVTHKRRRGRPPKVARPEDQLPQIPFPERLDHLRSA